MVSVVTEKNQPVLWKECLAWTAVVAYVAAILYGISVLDEQLSAFKLLVSMLGVAALLPLLLMTSHGMQLYQFGLSAVGELGQVVWPKHEEATRLTLVVVVAMTIVSLLLWGVDIIIASALRLTLLG